MGENDKISTLNKLKILIAKYIKKNYRELDSSHTKIINIIFKVDSSSNTIVSFDESQEYVVANVYPMDNWIEVINDALKESSCNGVAYRGIKGCVTIRLFGKPTKAFMMLARLIYRHTGKNLQWDEIKTFGIDSNPEDISYLCHNDEICQKGIDFIRSNKNRNYKLQVSIISEIINNDTIANELKLAIINNHGEIKKELVFTA